MNVTSTSTAKDLTVFARVPGELVDRPHWVVWRYVQRKGATTKVPYNAATGAEADSTDPATWSDYTTALEAYATHGNYDGIGFVFSADDPYVGIDLDDCLVAGAPLDWARDIIADLDTYTEISPSGNGVKLWARADPLPRKEDGGRRRKGNVEMYSDSRYFTVTGRHLPGTPRSINDRHAEIRAFYDSTFTTTPPQLREKVNGNPVPRWPTDDAIIDKIITDPKYARLWSGDDSGYQSASEADLALMGRIGFFAGWDPLRMEQVFDQSARKREKWDQRPDYRQWTIDLARKGKSESYQWDGNGRHKGARISRVDIDKKGKSGGKHGNSSTSTSQKVRRSPPPDYEPFPLDVLPEPLRSYVSASARHRPTAGNEQPLVHRPR